VGGRRHVRAEGQVVGGGDPAGAVDGLCVYDEKMESG